MSSSSNNYFACDYCGNLLSSEDPGIKDFTILRYGSFTVCEFCTLKTEQMLEPTPRQDAYYPTQEFLDHQEQDIQNKLSHLKRRHKLLKELTPYVQEKKQRVNSNGRRAFIRIRKE